MNLTYNESVRSFEKVNEIINKYEAKESAIITILQEIQDEYRYLPEPILTYVATAMGISPSKVFGVATFYENFSLEPKGKYIIKICDGTACHVRKSKKVLKKIREVLGLNEDVETTEDLLFTVETVSCLGACGLAPVILINDKVYGKVTPEEIEKVLIEIKEKEA